MKLAILALFLGIISFSPQSKIHSQLQITQARLDQVNQLLATNQLESVPPNLERYKSDLDEINDLAKTPQLRDEVNQALSSQVSLLISMYDSCNNPRVKHAIRGVLE